MRIGILGGGQLGRMLALSGFPLDLKFRLFDKKRGCAAEVAPDFIEGNFEDRSAIENFVKDVDVVTTEFENVPVATAKMIEELGVPFLPGTEPLRVAQDRLLEKQMFDKLSIPTTKYAKADSAEELESAVGEVGLPCVVKTRRMGYDGKGQKVLNESTDYSAVWKELGETPLLVEEKIGFEREVSQILVRDRDGMIEYYPLCENVHKSGILSQTIVSPDESDSKAAREIVSRIAEHFNYVGVLTVEFFERDGKLLANEIAPRVHNSGHWSMDGNVPSQFENHVRAVGGLPLSLVKLESFVGMVNLVGSLPDMTILNNISHARVHLYNKAPAAGRKIGHVNTVASSREELKAQMKEIQGLVP